MSSHHIIREKQEPALFINNMGSFNAEHLGQLLEWSPTVFVSTPSYDYVYSLGIKIDAVVSNSTAVSQLQEHMKIIPAINGNFTNACLNYLLANEYPSVNVINDSSFDSLEYSPFIESMDIVVFTAQKKIFPVRSGFSKWKPQGETVDVMDKIVETASFEGLLSAGKNRFVTQRDGFYKLHFNNDFIFIAEDL